MYNIDLIYLFLTVLRKMDPLSNLALSHLPRPYFTEVELD